jgi:ABC-type phosphate/phosphonate transport system substrate-binding protein
LGALVALICSEILFAGGNATEPGKGSRLHIALSGTMFHEVPEGTAKQALENLKSLIEKQTGRKSELSVEEKLDQLTEKLLKHELDMASVMGYEFAWVRLKNPKLRPLVIAVNGDLPVCAHLMVQKDNAAVGMKQLQGKTLALPQETLPSCRLYVERQCRAFSKSPQNFFAQITTPATLEDALDDVIDGAATATVVDSLCLDSYKRRKPGRATKLREVQKSIRFPPAAIIYEEGVLDEKELNEFRDDLLQAKQDADARRLLTLWKLTGFEPVPDDYEKTLADVAKEYPR